MSRVSVSPAAALSEPKFQLFRTYQKIYETNYEANDKTKKFMKRWRYNKLAECESSDKYSRQVSHSGTKGGQCAAWKALDRMHMPANALSGLDFAVRTTTLTHPGHFLTIF